MSGSRKLGIAAQFENMNLINQTEIDRLCRAYSDENANLHRFTSRQDKIEELLNAEFKKLQTLFRRKLSRVVKCPPSHVQHSRVWSLIAHGKTPVTVTPIASATIFVRMGIDVHLSFVATEENIEKETRALAAAIAGFGKE